MSLSGPRLAATLAVVCAVLAAISLAVRADPLPDSAWVALKPLPQQRGSAVFALGVDPANDQSLVAGNSAGSLLKSGNGGSSWSVVYRGPARFTTIAFNPLVSGLVMAGAQGTGAVASRDGGVTWSAVTGLDGRTVRVFGFALNMVAAGTDRGVYISQDGIAWTVAGLAGYSIDAIAVEAIHAPVHLVAASDSQTSGAAVSLFDSRDGGATWNPLNAPISGTYAVKLASGPLPPTGDTRPLLVGTNAGLFQSNDNGQTFTPLSGGALLPTTDYTQVAFITDHFDRFYAASDGGGSGAGGLWRTLDAGKTFLSMNAPVPAVTALAVSSDEVPILYMATFRPTDQVAELWAFHDTGGLPLGPNAGSGTRTARSSPVPAATGALDVLRSPQLPYELLGAAALIILVSAGVAHLRGRRR